MTVRTKKVSHKPRRHRAGLLGLTLTAILLVPATANATAVHFYSGGLAAGTAYQSSWAGSSSLAITYIQGDANHNNFCIAEESGWSGWGYGDYDGTDIQSCSSSGGKRLVVLPRQLLPPRVDRK